MIGLLVLGMAMVLQPTLGRGRHDLAVRIGATELLADRAENGYRIASPARLAGEAISAEDFAGVLDAERAAWDRRPAWERTLLGFFNITSWINFTWVAVGLAGQAAFFGRMFIQWVVSEKSRQSQVPELFWWLSFLGGLCLFTYFVWRVDVVGVLGQSTGIVIYARNLRLIQKQKRRDRRAAATLREEAPDAGAA
jgi:lipid-A-disaccharide synthase-like uncharacterized protein